MAAVAIFVQFGWIFLTLYHFSLNYTFVDICIHILAVIVALKVINNWSNPYYKLAWTFIILLFPLFGICLYLVFGRSELTKRTQERMDLMHREITECLKEDPLAIRELKAADKEAAMQSKYIHDLAQAPLYRNSKTKYYACGEDMFQDMLGAMERAKEFIFLEYFIIAEGNMLEKVLAVLERK